MNKKIIILILCICIFAIFGSLAFYMTRKHEWKNASYSSFHYGENQIAGGYEGVSSIKVNAVNELKINVSLHITAGEYTIGIYYIPEDHIMYRFHYATPQEKVLMRENGEFNPEMMTAKGLDCLYKKTTDVSDSFVIDTAGWKDGLYAISTITSEDADLYGTISIDYVYYNWTKWMERATRNDKYNDKYTPY